LRKHSVIGKYLFVLVSLKYHFSPKLRRAHQTEPERRLHAAFDPRGILRADLTVSALRHRSSKLLIDSFSHQSRKGGPP
jgi:hypothetical protein